MAETTQNEESNVLELELPYELWEALDEYAEQSTFSRQTIIVEALRAYLGVED